MEKNIKTLNVQKQKIFVEKNIVIRKQKNELIFYI